MRIHFYLDEKSFFPKMLNTTPMITSGLSDKITFHFGESYMKRYDNHPFKIYYL